MIYVHSLKGELLVKNIKRIKSIYILCFLMPMLPSKFILRHRSSLYAIRKNGWLNKLNRIFYLLDAERFL